MSVDKANVLDTSRLWRRVVDEVAVDHPDVRLRHALVDSFAMEIVTSPERIDVVVTENTFGDILSDVAAAVTGGLGLAASASLGDGGPGIFEPVHGSAPDIAGTGVANPSAMLRSVALLLEHGLGRLDLAAALDAAVDAVLAATPTRDAGGDATTTEFGDAVLTALEGSLGDDGGAMSVTVGFPGPPGSHSDAAASVLVPDAVSSVGLPSFSAVIDAATEAEVTLGVLPIESSLIGPIAETHDLLYGSALSIVREATLPIRHCLLGLPGARLETRDDAVVASRRVRPVPRPARRQRRASASRRRRRPTRRGPSPTRATRRSSRSRASRLPRAYGLEVIADDVGDHPGAFTRFVALAPYTQLAGGEGWRTALWFVTDHQPGALFRALGPLARNGVNLVQLVSRPLPNSPWRYRFDVVLDGHVFDPSVRPALAELRATTRDLRLFGSYAAEVVQ